MISETGANVHDVCDFSQNGTGSMKTVIHISDPVPLSHPRCVYNGFDWCKVKHPVSRYGNVDRTPCMSPAQSQSNISFSDINFRGKICFSLNDMDKKCFWPRLRKKLKKY